MRFLLEWIEVCAVGLMLIFGALMLIPHLREALLALSILLGAGVAALIMAGLIKARSAARHIADEVAAEREAWLVDADAWAREVLRPRP